MAGTLIYKNHFLPSCFINPDALWKIIIHLHIIVKFCSQIIDSMINPIEKNGSLGGHEAGHFGAGCPKC